MKSSKNKKTKPLSSIIVAKKTITYIPTISVYKHYLLRNAPNWTTGKLKIKNKNKNNNSITTKQ